MDLPFRAVGTKITYISNFRRNMFWKKIPLLKLVIFLKESFFKNTHAKTCIDINLVFSNPNIPSFCMNFQLCGKEFFCPTLYSQAEANPKRSIFFTHFNEVDPSIQKGSISPKCLPNLIKGQFHQHFMRAFLLISFCQTITMPNCKREKLRKSNNVRKMRA